MGDAPNEKMQAKAAELLLKGRVRVRKVSVESDGSREFRADVYSMTQDGDPYRVVHVDHWLCDCPARVPLCAHIVACQAIYEPPKAPVDPKVEAMDIDALLSDI